MNSDLLQSCVLCGHRCRVNRLKGQVGKCRAGINLTVASHCAHHGEEPMISGSRGSGTIFFSHCCLRCVFCQNYNISQLGKGVTVKGGRVAEMMLDLQDNGVHNINLVSPTHYAPQIMEALELAKQKGLKLPIVYNTGGFDSIELLKELEGKIEIYLPDLKYFNNDTALKYSGAANYAEAVKEGIAEMYRQVGNIKFDKDGVAIKGLLVRHLVLPDNLADSEKNLDFLASLSKDIWVSIMAQYNPQHRAAEFPEIYRRLRSDEYQKVVGYAEKIGLRNLYAQDLQSSDAYLPDFMKENPFKY